MLGYEIFFRKNKYTQRDFWGVSESDEREIEMLFSLQSQQNGNIISSRNSCLNSSILNKMQSIFVLNANMRSICQVQPSLSLPWLANNILHAASLSLPSFVFLENPSEMTPFKVSNFPIRLNQKMSGLSRQAQAYSFWNRSHLLENFSQQVFSRSLIVNPYKSEPFIKSALERGVTKMVVSDIDEISKVQRIYFSLMKTKSSNCYPQFLWKVQDPNADIENLKLLKQCDFQVSGLYFDRQISLTVAEKFQSQVRDLGYSLSSYKEETMTEYSAKSQEYRKTSIIPEIYDYSELRKYLMACRIIGTDKEGNSVYSEECMDFLCPYSSCSCQNVRKPEKIVNINGVKWAILNPLKVDQINKDMIINAQEFMKFNLEGQ